ncbi:hypothetical protein DMA11_18255 [Marinilabiliaceae bacterium JC017]|nr:hypothetical protein DMA11_18255 [Marinilabiliaceae bacterium JC017]
MKKYLFLMLAIALFSCNKDKNDTPQLCGRLKLEIPLPNGSVSDISLSPISNPGTYFSFEWDDFSNDKYKQVYVSEKLLYGTYKVHYTITIKEINQNNWDQGIKEYTKSGSKTIQIIPDKTTTIVANVN